MFLPEDIREPDGSREDAGSRLLDLIATGRLELNISCAMLPSILDKWGTMLRERGGSDEIFSRRDTWIVRKRPDRDAISIPADIVSSFIDEMSDRVDRGLWISEDAHRENEALDPAAVADGPDAAERDQYLTEADQVLSR